jgi:hypothetical protein
LTATSPAADAITVTLGLACLVYGLSSASMTTDGVSHWGDAKVVASLTAAVILLGAFVVIEARSRLALVPLRIFRNLSRSGAYLVMLCLGPTLLTGAGLGLLFTPLTLTSLSKVDHADTGLASSLINGARRRVGPGQHLGPRADGRVLPGFEVSAAIMVLALVLAAVMIRVTWQDLTGAQP